MSWVSFRKGLSDLKRLGSMCRQRQLFHRGFFICTLGVWPQDKEDFRNRCQLAGWCLWGFSAQSLCLLAFLLSFLHWGTQPVLWDLPVARPESLRTGSVLFELTGSPADGVAAQAERAKRGFVWVANLGTLWASFPGFAPWPFLEAASPLSSVPGWVSFHCSNSSPQWPSLAGSFLHCAYVLLGLLCTGAPLTTSHHKLGHSGNHQLEDPGGGRERTQNSIGTG